MSKKFLIVNEYTKKLVYYGKIIGYHMVTDFDNTRKRYICVDKITSIRDNHITTVSGEEILCAESAEKIISKLSEV